MNDMNVYVYQAELLCEDCGEQMIAELRLDGITDDAGDSDSFPQGPYPDGGGDADTPQHCGSGEHCLNAFVPELEARDVGCFLENPLTPDGYAYVLEKYQDFLDTGRGIVVAMWAEHYGIRNEDGTAILDQ